MLVCVKTANSTHHRDGKNPLYIPLFGCYIASPLRTLGEGAQRRETAGESADSPKGHRVTGD